MSIVSFVMLVIGLTLYTFLTDLNFLFLIILCLCGSYVIQARMQAIGLKDSFLGCVYIIVIIVGLIVACFGTFLLPQDPNVAINDAICHQNSTSTNIPQKDANDFISALSIGLGVIGFGIALFTYGLSSLLSIHSQYEFTELKVYLMDGPYFAKKYMRKLKPNDLIWIFGFWAIIGLIIIVMNYSESQSSTQFSGFASIRCYIGLFLIIIGLFTTVFGLVSKERGFDETIQLAITQLKNNK